MSDVNYDDLIDALKRQFEQTEDDFDPNEFEGMRASLESRLRHFPEKWSLVLEMRYGLGLWDKGLSYKEIGKYSHMSAEQVKLIEARALRYLREKKKPITDD